MPLKLERKKKVCEEIEFGNIKLKVPGAISFETMVEFFDLKNMDPKKLTKRDLKDMARLAKEILYRVNDKGKVNSFIADLEIDELVEVITFITNYLGEGSKKKDLKADSESS